MALTTEKHNSHSYQHPPKHDQQKSIVRKSVGKRSGKEEGQAIKTTNTQTQ